MVILLNRRESSEKRWVREGMLTVRSNEKMSPESTSKMTDEGSSPLHSSELRHLNRDHARKPSSLVSDRMGFLGSFLESILSRARRAFFGDYFTREVEYRRNLVRLLNEMAKVMDGFAPGGLSGLSAGLHDLDSRVFSAFDELRSSVEKAQRRIVREQLGQGEELKRLASVVGGLESIIAILGEESRASAKPSNTDVVRNEIRAEEGNGGGAPDFSYLMFENAFRGSEEEIKKRVCIYPPLFGNADGPVLELGAGRGELQELFREAKISSYAVESDSGMAALLRKKGLEVVEGDALVHLRSLDNSSLGGVIGIQIVEHLELDDLKRLFGLCVEKVKSEGLVVVETVNTSSVLPFVRNYLTDPTHRHPLHPRTLSFFASTAGLDVLERRDLSPYPDGALLREISGDFGCPGLVEDLNHNIRQLNEMLFGFQDYALIARVP